MESEHSITATHLRQNLGAVLDAVLTGNTVQVSRNGRPLVVLLPPERYAELTEPQAAPDTD